MITRRTGTLLRHLDRLTPPPGRELTDRELLGGFAAQQDEAAFTELVRRHGPMVWGVCRRLLRHEQDAEDAFQATFLVLAKKAGSGGWRDSVANWLYGVASHLSLRMKTAEARRQAREGQAAQRRPAAREDEVTLREAQAALDEQ